MLRLTPSSWVGCRFQGRRHTCEHAGAELRVRCERSRARRSRGTGRPPATAHCGLRSRPRSCRSGSRRRATRPDPRPARARRRRPAQGPSPGARNIAAGVGGEGAPEDGAPQLPCAHPPVPAREAPEAGETEGLENVREVHVTPPVALPREGQYGIRPNLDPAVHAPREVDAEKGIRGIPYRVDEAPDEVCREPVVLAAEGDDRGARLVAGRAGKTVRTAGLRRARAGRARAPRLPRSRVRCRPQRGCGSPRRRAGSSRPQPRRRRRRLARRRGSP